MRRTLAPLIPFYSWAIAIKAWLFERGLLAQRRLAHPVISVGSLSTGGAGKTPVVLMLAELLQARGFEVRILTRGYGRSGNVVERVDPSGDAARFGDEPLFMARRLKDASVYVGGNRFHAGRLAERDDTAATRAVYLLDDGFQHRRLARDADVVLITRKDFEDRLLPAGNLREPMKSLLRASLVIIRDDEPELLHRVASETLGGVSSIWSVHRQIRVGSLALSLRKPLVFCGVARPENFVALLGTAGVNPVHVMVFRDHHPYSADDIERLIEICRRHDSDGFVTTEKDAVKLSARMIARLEETGPLVVARLDVDLINEQASIDQLIVLLAAKSFNEAR